MSTASLSAFLVEDEPLCRADFHETLKGFPEIKLLGEADTLAAAQRFLHRTHVDLLFLDLSVGRDNGLDLVERLPKPPLVIALTAHPQHAVRGFALDLVDYILKPVEPERLQVALTKARQRKSAATLPSDRTTFLVEKDGQKTILELSEILRAESMGNYVLFHTPRGKALKRATFSQVRQKLPAPLFLEISRGRIVARHQITAWNRDDRGKLQLQLASGESMQASRSQATLIQKELEKESL